MRLWRKLELEWKILLLAVLLFAALFWPVQRVVEGRFSETAALSVDPDLEALLRSGLAKSQGAEKEAYVRSLERLRQWQALAPILEQEQKTGVAVFSVFMLLLLSGFAAFTLRRLTRPLKNLASAAEKIGQGERPTITAESGGALGRLEESMASMEAELSRLRGRILAEGMEEAWRDIARVIAHEIKNAVTPARLTLDRLEERLSSNRPMNAEEQARFTERLTALMDQLERLVASFGSFAREPEVKLQSFSPRTVLERVAGEFKDRIRSRFNGEGEATGDPLLFQQVALNLWKNAVEAGATEMSVTQRRDGGKGWMIEAADNGPGLSSDKLDKIFLPYVTYKPGGTGLGLAVVKRLMESMGGGVEITSAPGKGFKVRLSLAGNRGEAA